MLIERYIRTLKKTFFFYPTWIACHTIKSAKKYTKKLNYGETEIKGVL